MKILQGGNDVKSGGEVTGGTKADDSKSPSSPYGWKRSRTGRQTLKILLNMTVQYDYVDKADFKYNTNYILSQSV